MRLTKDEYESLLKRPSVAARNPELSDPYYPPRQIAKLEPEIINVAVPAASVQKASGPRFRVRFLSVRSRLIDEDNLACKFCTDQLRYRGIISDDCPGKTTISVTQRLCEKGEPEHVQITVEKI